MTINAANNYQPLPLRVQILHGVGAVAYGIKDNGFAYFLLLFYSTVVGLESALVGTALLIAMVLDAISDPVIGYWSDRTRSRWGRRHPFMYASAFPVAVCYAFLWSPPDWSSQGLFLYLLVMAVLIRTLITLFETPSSSLLPELTLDYDERTAVQSWRLFFAWTGGTALAVIMFGFLLVPTASQPIGTLNRDGYEIYGWLAAGLMFLSIMISTLGTQKYVRYFGPEQAPTRGSLAGAFGEIKETLFDKNFFALILSSISGSVATGLTAALSFLMLTYFWQFSSLQIFYWTALVMVSAVLGMLIAPRVARLLGKKRAVLVLGVLAFTIQPLPVLLRLLDVLPANGDPSLFPIIVTINTLDLGLIIAMQAVLGSMVADLVEQAQVTTGRRSEGVFFAAMTFVRKTNQGLGVFFAGLMLQWVDFPEGSAPSEVSPDVLWNLGATLIPSQCILWALMLWALFYYRIDRERHQANLAQLQR